MEQQNPISKKALNFIANANILMGKWKSKIKEFGTFRSRVIAEVAELAPSFKGTRPEDANGLGESILIVGAS